ncbi:hypothetical protein GEMRC1_006250 [Eukaryota sp. GEM-RC1]
MVTSLWQSRTISNFDYLMWLNTIAGRTFNDLSQYPVFPWVIQDYQSETLDLNNPEIYRNFTRPIGAHQENRLKKLEKKFDDTKYGGDPLSDQYKSTNSDRSQYHHAFHYMMPATVIYYLVRLEPFTSICLEFHNKKNELGIQTFDDPDRMFHDLGDTWQSTTSSPADLRELVPEFFYSDLFLRNVNGVFYGNTSSDKDISQVTLPKWAHGNPDLFIRINRAALESDYVSSQIHHWIDLIFGYQQRGNDATTVYNRYKPHCYYSMNFEKIKDKRSKRSLMNAIREFGQIPIQLFYKPHPQKYLKNVKKRLPIQCTQMSLKFLQQVSEDVSDSLFLVRKIGDQLITISRSSAYLEHVLTSKDFVRTEYAGLGNSLDFCNIDDDLTENTFTLCLNGKYLITCGHWDSSFKIFDTKSLTLVLSMCRHKDIITCCSIAESTTQSYLITASRDTTAIVWTFFPSCSSPIESTPLHVLHGHDAEISAISSNVDSDVVLTGSLDGTIIIHSLSRGRYLRSIEYPLFKSVDIIEFIPNSKFLAWSTQDLSLCLFSVNGILLNRVSLTEAVTRILYYGKPSHGKSLFDINFSHFSNAESIDCFVFLGFEDGSLEVWSVFDLKYVRQLGKFHSAITSLSLSEDLSTLIAGLDDGKLAVFSV